VTGTKIKKQHICESYKEYLEIIYHFGNKVMLQKQLLEYALILNLAKDKNEFYKQILELVEVGVIKRERFASFGKITCLHTLKLRKFGISFVEGKSSTQAVGAVRIANSNERIVLSMFKNTYVLKRLIPRLNKSQKDITVDSIKSLIKQDRSNILFNRNQGLNYLKNLDEDVIQHHFCKDFYQSELNILIEINHRRSIGLSKGSKASRGKGVRGTKKRPPKSSLKALETAIERFKENKSAHAMTKQEKLDKYNIDTMINSHCFVIQLREVAGQFVATILIFDTINSQDLNKIGMKIAMIYNYFFNLMKTGAPFLLKVGVVCLDSEALRNVEAEATKKVYDFSTKVEKGKRLSLILKSWKVTEDKQEQHLDIRFTHYNLTDEYLEGIKYSNLKRN
jgi:hypothetical protein